MKFTSAQAALLHAAESLGVSAIASVVAAMYQYFILHGFNVQGLVGVGCVTFIGAFSMLYKSLQNNPNLAPAIVDSVNELKDTAAQHTQAIGQLQALAAPAPPLSQPAPQVAQQFMQLPTASAQAPQFSFVPTTTYPTLPVAPQ